MIRMKSYVISLLIIGCLFVVSAGCISNEKNTPAITPQNGSQGIQTPPESSGISPSMTPAMEPGVSSSLTDGQVIQPPKELSASASGKIGFVADIEKETKENTDFRRVLYTGEKSQFVLMCLQPMEDIGMETHNESDQFFRFEEGNGTVVINGKEYTVKAGSGIIVPRGSKHNVLNPSKTDLLKLYTIYSPPNHLDKVVRKTKQDALATEEHFDGKTTE